MSELASEPSIQGEVAGFRYLLVLPFRVDVAGSVLLLLLTAVDAAGGVGGVLLLRDLVNALTAGRTDAAAWLGVGIGLVVTVTGVAHVLMFLLQVRLSDRAKLFVDTETVTAVSALRSLERLLSATFQNGLEVLRRERGRIGLSAMVVFQTIYQWLRFAGIAAVLLTVSPLLIALPIGAGVAAWTASRAERCVNTARGVAAADRRVADSLFGILLTRTGIQEAKIFDAGAAVQSHHEERLARAAAVELAGQRRARRMRLAGWLVFSLTYVVPLLALVLGWPGGAPAPLGQLVLVIVLSVQVTAVVAELHDAFTWLLGSTAVAGRHVELVRLGEGARADATEPVVPVLAQGLRLRSVCFGYPDGEQVLSDVDLVLPRGAVIALVGENGAGKSTLLNLILGLYQPTRGQVLVDSEPLRGWQGADLRLATGAFQDHVRYRFTLGRNVGVGEIRYLDDTRRITAALHVAGADGLARSLPNGLDQLLGDGVPEAVELSGGQWQRVAVARGLLNDAPLIMVFDEPSAALDPEIESALFEALLRGGRRHAARHGTITLIVSHRLASVRKADLVVVLAGGRVQAAGTHEEMLRRSPAYAQLYAIQADGYR